MRLSAARLKQAQSSPLRSRPSEGTKIGELYDLFIGHPLTPIHIQRINVILHGTFRPTASNRWTHCLDRLRQYGLDIRNYRYGWWWLVATDDTDFMAVAVAQGRAA